MLYSCCIKVSLQEEVGFWILMVEQNIHIGELCFRFAVVKITFLRDLICPGKKREKEKKVKIIVQIMGGEWSGCSQLEGIVI